MECPQGSEGSSADMIAGNDLLSQIEDESPKLGQYIRQYLLPSIQTTASNAAVDPHSEIPAPAAPESIFVTTAGELMQVVVNHTAPIQKGVQYLTHIATNPQFTNALIIDHGASRTPPHINLPTKDSTGATHSYYVATVAQYPGSKPSAPTFFGGVSPTAVTMSGTTQMDIQPGTGSGTAQNGGQALVGLGISQIRQAPGPRRSV
jgi:hypothetical protein